MAKRIVQSENIAIPAKYVNSYPIKSTQQPSINTIKLSQMGERLGANWGVYGEMKTGKSYTVKLLSLSYFRKGKRVLILDHNYNDLTYNDFWGITPIIINQDKFMEIEWNRMPDNIVVRIQPNSDLESFDFDKFFLKAKRITDSVLVLDDMMDVFGSKATSNVMNFPSTVMNNRNEAFYQFHTFTQAQPFLRQRLQNLVLKNLPKDVEIPKDFPTSISYIKWSIEEINATNEHLPFGKRFEWRIIHMDDGLVTRPVKLDGKTEEIVSYPLSQYFKNRMK
ncbi:hypothetical protein [Emticicia sp. BO119]|uniref:hypothetical protein n=1 Tax=Emticicia sp. BO119 TaxID=2757768 RepID=UPI0015F07D99|nr:hypothetical protein [Emticicia sp. BO119]MBA4849010.1 hypothetical protein [Emticicia sp. BO119]